MLSVRGSSAAGWVPQHRERIYTAGFRRPEGGQTWRIEKLPALHELEPPSDGPVLATIIEDTAPNKYTLGEGTWDTLVRHKAHHEAQGNGFGYGLMEKPHEGQITRTMSARYHKDCAGILIEQPDKPRPRRLTPLECSRLMGFPPEYQKYFDRDNGYEQPVSDTQAYRQFGNSVPVSVVTEIVRVMIDEMRQAGAI